ncbi:MAG: YCF48-related protein [Phycisphaerales bacterium]|nr:YCF48-related protein [Phycisphaerales bacterium]
MKKIMDYSFLLPMMLLMFTISCKKNTNADAYQISGSDLIIVGDTGSIFQSIDSGVTWINRRISPNDNNLIYSATFLGQQGWALADNFKNGSYIYTTADGGTTWQQNSGSQWLPFQPGSLVFPLKIAIASDGSGYMAANVDYIAGQLYYSSPGSFGTGWVFVPTPNTFAPPRQSFLVFVAVTTTIPNRAYIIAAASSSPDTAFLYVTKDAANSFITIPKENYTEQPIGRLFTNIQFVNPQVGFITNDDGSLYKTNDSGYNWTYIATPVTGNGTKLWATNFSDLNNGFAVGSEETILKTTNGGTTWTVVYSNPLSNNNLYSVLYMNNKVYAVGDSGVCLVSMNNGDDGFNFVSVNGTINKLSNIVKVR